MKINKKMDFLVTIVFGTDRVKSAQNLDQIDEY